MATPTLTRHQLSGALGEILVDVRAGNRGRAQPAVLLLHGFKGFKDFAFIPVFAERLARSGYTAVAASVSGSGVDATGEFTRLDRFARNTYSRELDDLGVVVAALQAGALGVVPPSSIAVVGHSRGGGMALLLARETPAIAVVATWSAIGLARRHTDAELDLWKRLGRIEVEHQRLHLRLPLDYEIAEDCLRHEHGRLDIPAAARELGRPWLQIHGTADATVRLAEANALSDAAGEGEGHCFLAITGADHTYGTRHPWAGSTPTVETVFTATLALFSRHLD